MVRVGRPLVVQVLGWPGSGEMAGSSGNSQMGVHPVWVTESEPLGKVVEVYFRLMALSWARRLVSLALDDYQVLIDLQVA